MDEEVKTMKVLSKKFSHIVDYYDFILLHRDDRNPIIITNQILNHILSEIWELVEAHTIVVPLLQEVSWLNFLEQPIQLDLWEEYMGH